MKLEKHQIAFIMLFIFYTVGIVGLSWNESKNLFLSLTPFNLLLTLLILAWGHGKLDQVFVKASLFAFLVGYLVEVAGVHTGLLFGEYAYGKPLGWQLFDVPLMIGVNWFLLAYASLGTARFFTGNKWMAWIIASLLMVFLDFFIEPVAVTLDFWTWAGGDIPIRNYIMWFITAFVVQMGMGFLGLEARKKLALVLLIIQFYFFITLNFLL